MSSGFVKPISEGEIGTFVRYNPDELMACKDNHERMLQQTNQDEGYYKYSLLNVFASHQQKQKDLGANYFQGAAKRFPVETQISPTGKAASKISRRLKKQK